MPPTLSPSSASDGGERPLVIVVLPRIVELVVQQDRGLTPALFSHGRPSYALRRRRLLEIVDVDELGLDDRVTLPPEVVLVAQQRQWRLGGKSQPPGMRTWRLAFAAMAVLRLRERREDGVLTMERVLSRIDGIGWEAFAEVESVLWREGRLFDDDDLVRVYGEFLVLFAELKHFGPDAVATFFPSLEGREEEMAALVEEDLAPQEFIDRVRPEGCRLPSLEADEGEAVAVAEEAGSETVLPPLRPHSKRYDSFVKWAETALENGNSVVGAILYRRASRFAPDQERMQEADRRSHEVIDGMVERLQGALAFPDECFAPWKDALIELFDRSSRGFWNANKRLLYDLQKVCVDFEQERFTVDLFGFLRTFGRRPLRRPLPNQKEVLMAKHLQGAASRLPKALITSKQRAVLSNLLRDAAASAEQQLRERLRPRIARSLNEKGLRPENLPERVARAKLIEELLDAIVSKGHLNMADVRDAISRSQLKLSDLTMAELWRGDAILRADQRLNRLLDGVYRRGEFYLRGLQRLSSLCFGRPATRFLIEYLVVPFGGAFVILKAERILQHALSRAMGSEEAETSWLAQSTSIPEGLWNALRVPGEWRFDALPHMLPAVLAMGVFLMGLLHAPGFRGFVWAVIQTVFRVFKQVVVDAPRWLMTMEWARWILRSRLAKAARRYCVAPLIPTLVLYGLGSLFLDFNRYTATAAFVGLFVGLNYFLNSSLGRRFEERVGALAGRVWYRFRVQFIRLLFDAVMGLFRRFIEITERVLYAIDEWLLFKRGENRVMLWIKGVMGAVWSVIAYGIRFCVTLLVEPQINPIKHFPVVTVSHKILLPSQPFLAGWLTPAFGGPMAYTVAGAIVFLTPGVFGFLVWELKSNWKLYRANRDTVLKPVALGPHGESLSRLLKPGFHSGAIGKLHGRLRRAARQSDRRRRRRLIAQSQERLHHLEVCVRHYVERELFGVLKEARPFQGLTWGLSDIKVLPSAIHLRLVAGGRSEWRELAPLHLLFQVERDWMAVRILEGGWVNSLEPEAREALAVVLAGFYKTSGVEFADEQVRQVLSVDGMAYHLRWSEMEVWSPQQRELPVLYPLRTWGTIRPHPSGRAKSLGFTAVNRKQLLFGEREVAWQDWVSFWEGDEAEAYAGSPVLADAPQLLASPRQWREGETEPALLAEGRTPPSPGR